MNDNVVLTHRKKEILQLVSTGLTDKEVAHELHITINTVKTHLKQIYKILEVKNRMQAVQKCHTTKPELNLR